MKNAHIRSNTLPCSSQQKPLSGGAWRRLISASLCVAAWGALGGCRPDAIDQEEPAQSCGQGHMERFDGGVYCIYQQPIIETRFECPAFAPHLSRHGEHTVVCASTVELPDALDDLISMDPGQPVEDPDEPVMVVEPGEDMGGSTPGEPTGPVVEPAPVCEHGFGDGCQDAIGASPSGAQPYGGQSLAIRLAKLLWDDAPDAALSQAAADGALSTRSGVHAQVDRMMQDPRFYQNMDQFWTSYLGLERLQSGVTALDTAHPRYTPTLAASLLSSALETVHALTLEDAIDVRDVWTSQEIVWNADIAPYYGESVTGQGFERGVMAAPSAGILSHPALLTGPGLISYRGAAALSQLCVELPPVPEDVAEVPSDAQHPTYRQGLEAIVAPAECAACHAQLDAPGFALYGFDAMGQRQELDSDGQAFDTSGEYGGVLFADTGEFVQLFRDDARLSSCVTRRLYEHLGRGVTGIDAATISPVIHAHLLGAGTFTMKDLVRALATSDTMLYRP